MQGDSTVRPIGSRQSNMPPLLGKYHTGRHQIDTSSEKVDEVLSNSYDESDSDDISNGEEGAKNKRDIAVNRARMLRGKRSMLQPGEVETESEEEVHPSTLVVVQGRDRCLLQQRICARTQTERIQVIINNSWDGNDSTLDGRDIVQGARNQSTSQGSTQELLVEDLTELATKKQWQQRKQSKCWQEKEELTKRKQ